MIGSARRYYLAKRYEADLRKSAMAGVWQAKQEAEPFTVALPVGFPMKAELALVGYTTKEDLVGADADELMLRGFSGDESSNILSALAAL